MRTWRVLAIAARIAFHNLMANKLRSALTIVGVIIGVGAVIVMVAVGHGARERVLQEFQAMGTDLLLVFPGRKKGHGGVSLHMSNLLEPVDAEAILRNCPSVGWVAPETSKPLQVKYFDENVMAQVLGTTPQYERIRYLDLSEGRFFDENEASTAQRVCVLGAEIAEKLFHGAPSVGEKVRIRGAPYQVVGVLVAKGRAGFNSLDEQVVIPIETWFRKVSQRRVLRMINVKARDPALVDRAMREIEDLMVVLHPPPPGDEPLVAVFNFTEILGRAESAVGAFAFLIAASAGLSLLVGGIGIMNIMMVSVTERTREIGVRKALGATRRDILVQFLGEAVVVAMLGGLLGLAIGGGGVLLLQWLGDFNAEVPLWAVLAGLGVSGSTGIVFGVYPAWRAAQLDPIEALRWE